MGGPVMMVTMMMVMMTIHNCDYDDDDDDDDDDDNCDDGDDGDDDHLRTVRRKGVGGGRKFSPRLAREGGGGGEGRAGRTWAQILLNLPFPQSHRHQDQKRCSP